MYVVIANKSDAVQCASYLAHNTSLVSGVHACSDICRHDIYCITVKCTVYDNSMCMHVRGQVALAKPADVGSH